MTRHSGKSWSPGKLNRQKRNATGRSCKSSLLPIGPIVLPVALSAGLPVAWGGRFRSPSVTYAKPKPR